MRISELIDLMVYLLIIQLGFWFLLRWLYEGPYHSKIFLVFSVLLYLGTIIWLYKDKEK